MAGTKAVRIDDKGRVTLPKTMRDALGLQAGDTVFLKYEPQAKLLRLAPAIDPFDAPAEDATRGGR